MGLFDRPASPDCLAALRAEPAIAGLTDEIVPLADWQWNKALKDVESLDLITLESPVDSSFSRQPSAFQLNAHPPATPSRVSPQTTQPSWAADRTVLAKDTEVCITARR